MKDVKHIFFDLDHTLWDHDANARKTLSDMYDQFEIGVLTGMGKLRFMEVYTKVNNSLWDQYSHGQIDRDYLRNERFKIVLTKCGATDISLSDAMSKYFLENCPKQRGLMDGADVVLNYLTQKYEMSLITNGFEDVQKIKIKASGLEKFFVKMYTSETIGAKKPDRKIFEHALEDQGLQAHEAVMIGDNLKADIYGAQAVNITPIFYNPLGVVKSDCEWQISHLQELMKIL